MRWPWSKSSEVDEALSGSARRLEHIKQIEAKLEPKFRELADNEGRNHFEEAVTRVFKVAPR
jgi:hypothetical protein